MVSQNNIENEPLDGKWEEMINCRQKIYTIENHYDEFTDLYDALPNKAEAYAVLDKINDDFANGLVGEERERLMGSTAFNPLDNN